ncbi:MAG TPA: tRNA (adenosine(37)-N6)-threonylcarbamoyltransferase complex ATPase subunit type 1 TsaE [Chthoniobacterales bacterium]|nr:tRNA (adenosine(37)-N6)-threonylcarbamoyltransferase complex ATPase subunit type 1 TsaE [Chthoniobacterales bacterium]
MATFISNSAAETKALGKQLAHGAKAGLILALQGELGAGKTEFTKGLAEGLNSSAVVTSPTFTIIHEYGGGRLPIYHFDFFRLEDRQRLNRLGLDDYFFGDGVCIVEWADRFPDLIPDEARWIRFTVEAGEQRKIEFE